MTRGRILALAALAAMTVAGPAAAQSWTGINEPHAATLAPQATDTHRQVEKIDRSIRAGRKSGQLSHAEARRLHRAAAALDAMATRYADDGVSAGEAGELDTRADLLSHQVFYDRLTTSAAASH